ncbi:unnamed protein product, partial [Linum tenue]
RERVEELKKYVRRNLLSDDHIGEGGGEEATVADERVEMIDTLQRLGIGYHFEPEIQNALRTVEAAAISGNNLHTCALRFRLLRQAGIWVSPDEDVKFKEEITSDVRGLLSLYEASYLGIPDENVLDEAKIFARSHLHKLLYKAESTTITSHQLSRALELPSHWRIRRSEARWHIEQYKDTEGMDPAVLELAMLDFNMVQLVYQTDLEDLNRWWKELALTEKLEFARDRLNESFLWGVSLIQEPQFSYCRKIMSKLVCLINAVDDVYDVYGSPDELQLFTAAILRWDAEELDELPEYMKICFMAVYNTANELAYYTIKQQGFNCLPYLKQAWKEQCRLYLEEANTFHNVGFDQTFEEYLDHGWKTVASSIVLIHTYAASGETLTKEAFEYLTNYPKLTRWEATVARLTNDLATSKAELERGDILKSIERYMKEKGVSEEEARKYIQWRIGETWKRINEEVMKNSDHRMGMYVNLAVNLARGHHFMYHSGDANGFPTEKDKDQAMKLLYQPLLVLAMEDSTTSEKNNLSYCR